MKEVMWEVMLEMPVCVLSDKDDLLGLVPPSVFSGVWDGGGCLEGDGVGVAVLFFSAIIELYLLMFRNSCQMHDMGVLLVL